MYTNINTLICNRPPDRYPLNRYAALRAAVTVPHHAPTQQLHRRGHKTMDSRPKLQRPRLISIAGIHCIHSMGRPGTHASDERIKCAFGRYHGVDIFAIEPVNRASFGRTQTFIHHRGNLFSAICRKPGAEWRHFFWDGSKQQESLRAVFDELGQ